MAAQLAADTSGIAEEIQTIKAAMEAHAAEALLQAQHMDRDRPYSSPPPAIHPVWSDELRAESARLREEGLVAPGVVHPWEVDPVAWPSEDPIVQQELLGVQAERQDWLAFAEAVSDTPDADMPTWLPARGWQPSDNDRWGIGSQELMTGIEAIHARPSWVPDVAPTVGSPPTPDHHQVSQDLDAAARAATKLRAQLQERTHERAREGLSW